MIRHISGTGQRVPHTKLFPVNICLLLTIISMLVAHGAAFTAHSLEITVHRSGDATAIFQYSLEGVIENAIPDSLLKEELKKGVTTSSSPPEVLAFDRSGATMILRQFALTRETETGIEYTTTGMDFNRAEIALQNSALNYIISADFSPHTTTLVFPDGYRRTFTDSATLPSQSHTVTDPTKSSAATISVRTGTLRISSSPDNARILLDAAYLGESPGTFTGILPGTYTVTIEREGYFTETRTVIIEAERQTTVSVALSYATPTTFPDEARPINLIGFNTPAAVFALAAVVYLARFWA